jgi:hypothetical protein
MKLSLDSLREKAETVVSQELLNSITGGRQNDCHEFDELARRPHLIK